MDELRQTRKEAVGKENKKPYMECGKIWELGEADGT